MAWGEEGRGLKVDEMIGGGLRVDEMIDGGLRVDEMVSRERGRHDGWEMKLERASHWTE